MQRRSFLGALALQAADSPQFATGTRVGEVTQDSAIVWVRLTRNSVRNNQGVVIPGRINSKTAPIVPTVEADALEGACPPAAGRLRLSYSTEADLSRAKRTGWVNVSESEDGIHRFQLTGLKPGTTYHYAAEAGSQFRGKFRTAPVPSRPSPIRFCVMTCQGYPDRGHADGHPIYPSMQALDPDFAVLTGDLVYYDNDQPRATSVRLARYHWERMFSLPRLLEFNRNTSTYWLKDDHDTLSDDAYPGMSQGELTFAMGQKLFLEQAPLGKGLPYRTYRWGKDLQVWFTDGRDFRSSNKIPDGPEKTIWGAEQKAWFQRTMLASDATFKVLVSPTPFVGPDRKTKNDNHSNSTYQHEGDELRSWFAENLKDQFVVICGDRHWQYHSIHPKTKLNEFSVGPASNEHAGGTPGEDPAIHQFHRVQGGFLAGSVKREGSECVLTLELRDVSGKVAYSWNRRRRVS